MASSHNRSRAVARLRIVIPLLVVAAGIWAGIVYLRNDRANPDVLTASGTIEASQVSAASKIPGRILRLHAAEGDVRAGTPLVTIEGRELLAQIDQARAVVARRAPGWPRRSPRWRCSSGCWRRRSPRRRRGSMRRAPVWSKRRRRETSPRGRSPRG